MYDDGCGQLFEIIALLLFIIACTWAGGLLLEPYAKKDTGQKLGCLLGPVGVVIAWIMRMNLQREEPIAVTNVQRIAENRNERECPHCAELILSKAKVCKHCGRDVEPIPEPPAGDRPDNSPLMACAPR